MSLLYKTVEKGTRGSIIGLNNLMTSIGLIFIAKFGPYLFENVSIYAPFVFVGACDVFYILLLVVLRITGKFTK